MKESVAEHIVRRLVMRLQNEQLQGGPLRSYTVTDINNRKINGFHWGYFTILRREPVAPFITDFWAHRN